MEAAFKSNEVRCYNKKPLCKSEQIKSERKGPLPPYMSSKLNYASQYVGETLSVQIVHSKKMLCQGAELMEVADFVLLSTTFRDHVKSSTSQKKRKLLSFISRPPSPTKRKLPDMVSTPPPPLTKVSFFRRR